MMSKAVEYATTHALPYTVGMAAAEIHMTDAAETVTAGLTLNPGGAADHRPSEGAYGELEHLDPYSSLSVRIPLIASYSLVFVACVTGNILVLFVILRHRRMRHVTSFFLANLAMSDLFVGVFCVTQNLSSFLSPPWLIGRSTIHVVGPKNAKYGMLSRHLARSDCGRRFFWPVYHSGPRFIELIVMCKLYYFVQCLSYTASIVILTIISAERYLAIIHPILSKRFSRMCLLRIVVMVAWGVSVTYSLPLMFSYDLVIVPRHDNGTDAFCVALDSSNQRNKIYVIVNVAFLYVLPLALMTTIYVRISIVLWRSSDQQRAGALPGGLRASRGRSMPIGNVPQARRGHFVTTSMVPTPQRRIVAGASSSSSSHVLVVEYEQTATMLKSTIVGGPSGVTRGCDGAVGIVGAGGEGEGSESGTVIIKRRSMEMLAIGGQRRSTRFISCGTGGVPYSNDPEVEPASLSFTSRGGSRHRSQQQYRYQQYPSISSQLQQQQQQPSSPLIARRKVIRLLIAIVACFAACMLPHNARLVWQTFFSDENSYDFSHFYIPPITFILFYANSAINPFLYAFLSNSFQKALSESCSCRLTRPSAERRPRYCCSSSCCRNECGCCG